MKAGAAYRQRTLRNGTGWPASSLVMESILPTVKPLTLGLAQRVAKPIRPSTSVPASIAAWWRPSWRIGRARWPACGRGQPTSALMRQRRLEPPSAGRRDLQNSLWRHLEPPGLSLFKPSWAERADMLIWMLTYFEDVAAQARADVGKPATGRPKDTVAKQLVARLGELWRTQTGKAPTVWGHPYSQEKSGDFLWLCREIIEPLWRNRGLEPPGIEDLVKNYRWPRD